MGILKEIPQNYNRNFEGKILKETSKEGIPREILKVVPEELPKEFSKAIPSNYEGNS